jgi:two-component system, NtrC family, sensor kinase
MRQHGGGDRPVKRGPANRPKPRKVSTATASITGLQKQVDTLTRELKEASERQTATAEVLQVINSSPGNLSPVFNAMLDKALALCGAAFGVLWTFDGERMHVAALRGVPSSLAEFLTRSPHPVGRDNAHARLLSGEAVVHVSDVGHDKAYRTGDPISRALVKLGGGRSMLAVPLRAEKTFFGDFIIYRQQVKRFSDKQIRLLQNFAAQAVTAIENARLLRELRGRTADLTEALEQRTATSEVLRIISSFPGDVQPVFASILENASRICEAKFGVLMLAQGDAFGVGASHNAPQAFVEFMQRRPVRPSPQITFGRAVATKRVAQTTDITIEQPYLKGDPLAVAAAELGGYRTVLAVPMLKESNIIGALVFFRQEVRAFNDKQIDLVQSFAAQAVIAIENARLLTEQREALEQQTASAEVLQVINSSPGNLAPVFDAMLQRAMRLCEAAFGGLWVFEGDHYTAAALSGVPPAYADYLRHTTLLPGPGTAPYRFLHGERSAIQNIDLAAEEPYRAGDPQRRALVDIGGARTALQAPLVRDDVVLGVITVYRQEVRPFSDKQIALVENFAAQAVIAMENARLFEELRNRQAELRVTFDNMGDGVAMFGPDTRLLAWNRNFQTMLDLPDELLIQRPTYIEYVRILAERGEFGTDDIEGELSRRLEHTDRELRIERTRPDGRVIEVRRNTVPGGGFVLIYSDITERKRGEEAIRAARDAAEAALRDLQAAQASLIHAQKMAALGQLTAGIAHEIKNPLNFVNNFAGLSVELLQEVKEAAAQAIGALEPDKRTEILETIGMLTENLEKIAQHGRRADGIVRGMLQHSRGSSGDWQAINLNAVVEESLNLAYHGARAQDQDFNVTFEFDRDPNLAPVEAVSQDVSRVLLNLISNGFYAVSKRAREEDDAFRPALKIMTRDFGEGVEIRIRDNGVGIPPEHREKLFQPFFTTKPTGEGTGLGLSISYEIITRQHGGTITVDSEVGGFTEFTIRLPRRRHPVV